MSTHRGHAGTGREREGAAFAETRLPSEADEAVDPWIGKVLHERYRVDRLLGEGGMGAVYEAEHLLLRRRVAIKFLHGHFARDAAVVKRFQNEAIAASSIGSPHIVEVTDMGRLEDGALYMVLEYLEGRSLAQVLIDEGALSIGRAMRILMQVCRGLSAAHEKGIVHRDLKPDNIYLTSREGEPEFAKILDFGVAKLRGEHDHRLTATGQAIGTPYYMPPEQVHGKREIDERADLYSLGVILFECLTDQFPFDDESFPMLVVKICHEPPPPLRAFRPDAPPRLEALVGRLLAKSPQDRHASAGEVREALAEFTAIESAPELDDSAPRTVDVPLSEEANARSGIRFSDPGAAAEREGIASSPTALASPSEDLSAGASPRVRSRAAFPETGQASAARASTAEGDAASSTQPSAPAAAPAAPSPGSKLPLVVALGSSLVALAVVALLVLRDRAEPPPAPPAPSPPAQQTEQPRGGGGAESVRVQIETVPPEAELSLDGEPIPNPFDADLPRTEERRELEARLDGYRTETRRLALRFPQRVRIEMHPEPEERAEPPTASDGTDRNQTERRRRGARIRTPAGEVGVGGAADPAPTDSAPTDPTSPEPASRPGTSPPPQPPPSGRANEQAGDDDIMRFRF